MKHPRTEIRSMRKKEINVSSNEEVQKEESTAMIHIMPISTIANIIRSDEMHEANNIFVMLH